MEHLRLHVAVSLSEVQTAWTSVGIEHSIVESRSRISLGKILVPAGQRGRGIGSAAMQMLNEYADFTGQAVLLSPSDEFGATSKSRLQRFYQRIGFLRNAGKHRDFTISDSMYRLPGEVGHLRGRAAYVMAGRDGWLSDCDFEARGARLAAVTPALYIAKVRPLVMDDMSRDVIDQLKERILGGLDLDPVAVYSDGSEDGRHRAHAARELGVQAIPVLDFFGCFASAPAWPLEVEPLSQCDGFRQRG